MDPKKWRARYAHIPRTFHRRWKVLQTQWGMTTIDFSWHMGVSLENGHQYRQGRGMPTLTQVSKMENAAGIQAVNYLMACPASRCPRQPKENTGKKGPGKFELSWLKKKKKQRLVMLKSGELGYE